MTEAVTNPVALGRIRKEKANIYTLRQQAREGLRNLEQGLQNTQQELRILSNFLNQKYAVQPAIVFDTPSIDSAALPMFGTATRDLILNTASGNQLILEDPDDPTETDSQLFRTLVRPEIEEDSRGKRSFGNIAIGITGRPIFHKWAEAAKEDYTLETDNLYNIPKFFLTTAKQNGHLALYIEHRNILYSLGFGHLGMDILDTAEKINVANFAKRAYRAREQAKDTLELETKILEGLQTKPNSAEPKLGYIDKAIFSLIERYYGDTERRKALAKRSMAAQKKSVGILGKLQEIKEKPMNQNYKGMMKGSVSTEKAAPYEFSPNEEQMFEAQEALLTKAAMGVFYSPDTLVKPKFKNSKEHYWKHRLVAFGFLKRTHVERLQVFLDKHDYEGLLYLDYVPGPGETPTNESTLPTKHIYDYKFAGFNIPTSIEYRLLSNEDIVKQINDQANCTSILASVFREQISCLTRMPILPSKFSLEELFQIQSFGLVSNPTACQLRGVTAYKNVTEMFRAYMTYLFERLRARATTNDELFQRSSKRKSYVPSTNESINFKPDEILFDSLNGTYETKRISHLGESSYTKYGLRKKAAETLPYFVSKRLGLLGGRRTKKRHGKKNHLTRRR